jgi:hypothetical protein
VKHLGLAAMAAIVLVGAAGCSKSPTPGGANATTTVAGPSLPFEGSPSDAVLAEAAGLTFPTSINGYRSVRVAANELDVSFTIPATDLDAFVTDSHFGALVPNKKIINHPSPVWDLTTTGTVQSAVSTRRGIERGIEVVASAADPNTDTVRLVVAKN